MNTHKYLFLGLFALSISSCNDFLDREPLDKITPESYFQTAEQLSTYALTQYNFKAHFGSGYDFGVYRDDNNTDVQVSSEGNLNRWAPGIQTVPDGDGGWTFGDIYKCNYFFDQVLPKYEGGMIQGNVADIKHYIGEMYMIRANCYFNYLKKFGDFPIIEHNIALDDKEALIKANERKPMTTVARFILSDLDKAIELMEQNASDDNKRNRLTKEAAYLLKSRVALYVGSWLNSFQGTAFVPGGQGWPGAEKDYNANVQVNVSEEIAFFLDESMKASKFIADNISLTENNLSNYEEERNPYVRMFADKDLSSYDEVIFWRAGVSEDYRRTIELTDMSKESCLLSAYTAGKLVDKTMFNIRRERACELMSEGFRWDDLRRWRSMDQLVNTPYQVEGFKLWGEMKNWYTGLHYEGDGQGTANVSSPALSDYIRPYQIIKDNNSLYDGLKWTPANYLSPIGISQFTITSASVSDISSSPLYQNPGWPKVAGGVAESVPGF